MTHSISRREFLQLMTAAGLSLSFSPFACAQSTRPRYSQNMGVQLYTVRKLLKENPVETLRAIARIGFKHVELHDNRDLSRLAPLLRQAGLRITSTHITPALVTGNWEILKQFGGAPQPGDNIDSVISETHKHGLEYIVFPWLFPEERGNLDFYRKLAEKLNITGEKCKAAGIKLCYHNHSFEFEPEDGATPFSILVAELDPNFVNFEFDVFWVSIAGLNPVEFLREYGPRCQLLHLKDLKAGTPPSYDAPYSETAFEEVGGGIIDFHDLLKTAKEFEISNCYVEQDHTPGNPIDSLRESFQYLYNLNV